MIKIFKNIIFLLIVASGFSATAQSTTSSPYSGFGVGSLQGSWLPQNRAIGSISAGLRRPSTFADINVANPASYSAIDLTTFDIAAFGSFSDLSKGNTSEKSFDATLNHIAFAVPVNRRSALSFGLLPFSRFGYQFQNTQIIQAVTPGLKNTTANFVYKGEGGISKAYLGYGFQVGEHLSLGFNASYLFGKLSKTQGAEFPSDPAATSSRNENSNSITGFNLDYGLQYFVNLSKRTKLTIGYAGTAQSKLKSNVTSSITYYSLDILGNENIAFDTVYSSEDIKSKIKIPSHHTVGFTLTRTNRWLVGADFNYSAWSNYREGNNNPDFNNTYGMALGGQLTPDVTSINNYFKLIDYRLGVRHDKTYINVNDTDINQTALTLGLGLPLRSNRSTFYKINIAAELGQRGTLKNDLVREKYVNLYLGFTLNDKWFQKYKFD